MAIKRHDEATKLLQKAIKISRLGGFFTIMDAGAAEDLPGDVQGKLLPAWLFASSDPAGDPPATLRATTT